MPLDKQIVGVNFTGGLDTQTDRRLVIPGKMVALQNATLADNDTFQRRNGNTALLSGTAFASVATRGNELLALDGATLKSYSPATGTMATAGAVANLTVAAQQVQRSTGGQDSYDVATSGGVTCYVWRAFSASGSVTGVNVTVRDESTGAVLLAETSMRTTTSPNTPKVVVVTGAFIIFYSDGGGPPGTIYARVIQTSAPGTLGAETAMVTDLSAAGAAFDACAVGTSAFIYYTSTDATYSTRAFAVTRSGTTPSVSAGPLGVTTVAALAVAGVAGISIAAYSASLLGVFLVTTTGAATPGMWAGVVTAAMAVSVASAQKDATAAVLSVANITAVLNGTTMFVYSDDYGRKGEATATARLVRRTGLDSTNAIVSAAVTWTRSMTRPNGTNGPFISAKAFLVGATVYVPMKVVEAGTGTAQNTWLLLNDSAVVVAHAFIGTYGPNITTVDSLSASIVPSSGVVALPVGQRTLLSLAPNLTGIGPVAINVSATGMARLDLNFTPGPPVRAPLGPTTWLANAILSNYDGSSAAESGFFFFPEVVTAATGGGGNVPDGTHGIVVLYEWIDGQGQRHQSAPSVPIQLVVAAGPLTCTITAPTLPLTQKSNVSVVAYATVAEGGIYHRVNAVSSPVANSTTAPTVTITYNLTDANLELGEVLYTDGGALPNNSPPPCSAPVAHQNRLFINPGDDPFATQFSQPWVNGFGLQWNETLRFYVESTGGRPTGYASMDDKLIVFRPRKIGILFGQGPGTAGVGGSYQLQDLPTDIGCSEPRSILVMPQGVIFKSTSKGWYLLGRDLQLTWIGEGVQEWDSQGVTSAVLLDTEHECRFTTNDTDGLTLVYFYPHEPGDRGQWGTYSGYTGVDAVWWPGGNAYVRATATKLIKELPANGSGYAYGDLATNTTGGDGGTAPVAQTGSAIPMVFQTGWLKPGEALQAFQRIWRVLLTGDAVGYPPPQTTINANLAAGPTTIIVASTAAFTADQALGGGLSIGLGTANYEVIAGPYTITTSGGSPAFGLSSGTVNPHSVGELVRGTPAAGAAGTLEVKFYFDGNDSTAYQTITISDVADLVNGNSWDVRLQPNLQKCQSIMMKVTSTPASNDPGASLNFSGMTMELGVKKGAKKYNAARSL